jgi:hypothetical protein
MIKKLSLPKVQPQSKLLTNVSKYQPQCESAHIHNAFPGLTQVNSDFHVCEDNSLTDIVPRFPNNEIYTTLIGTESNINTAQQVNETGQ